MKFNLMSLEYALKLANSIQLKFETFTQADGFILQYIMSQEGISEKLQSNYQKISLDTRAFVSPGAFTDAMKFSKN